MRRRTKWLDSAAAAFALFVAAAPATAAEPDSEGPSVCVPPCEGDKICVGGACVDPSARPRTGPARRPTTPPPAQPPPASPPPSGPASPPGQPTTAAPRPAAPAPAQQPGTAPPPPAGYAPPPGTYPPPPGTYPPPPPGYYQPPPPGYYQPPPGQQPPPGSYQPPPGYYAPPPGYYPPPGYAPPGTYYPPPPRRLRKKRGFLAMPYLGAHSYRNGDASAYDAGLRLGSLIGGRINDIFSLNGEMTIDVSNRNDVPSGTDYQEWNLNVAFSPLLQIPAGGVELVFGPKLGLFFLNIEQSDSGSTAEVDVTGWLAGLNAGLLFPVSPTTSLGLLVSYQLLWAESACVRSGSAEFCDSVSSDAAEVLALSGAVIF
jgi:hypothetical protein